MKHFRFSGNIWKLYKIYRTVLLSITFKGRRLLLTDSRIWCSL